MRVMRVQSGRSFQWLVLACICFFLTACITAPKVLFAQAQPSTYTYLGRFALTFETPSGAVQREQGGFEWRVFGMASDQAMQVLLTAPLGATVAALQYDPLASLTKRASLQTPQGTYFAESMPALMQRILGWELPLNALLPWLSAAAPAQEHSEPLDGWAIRVLARDEKGLPKTIHAQHEARKITLRVVFNAP